MERTTEENEEDSSLYEKAISIRENIWFILHSCTSREEFERKYKMIYQDKMKAEEYYHAVLSELKKELSQGNINNFKKLENIIYFISEIENKNNLRSFYDNENNPLKNTNAIILACKHNQGKILEYLFLDRSCKILKNLSVDIGRDSILPDDEDNDRRNAFYYAIRSGSIEILDILISNSWANGTYNFIADSDKLKKILSRALEELKLKNFPVEDVMQMFVLDKLMDVSLHSSGQSQIIHDNLNSIKERIDLVFENISLLNYNYSKSEKVDQRFLFIAKVIVKNIHILKQKLKSTYVKLPWEEIEFCLLTFISFHTKEREVYLYCYAVLDKRKLLNFLKLFAKKLKDVIKKIHISEDYDLSKLNRDKVVADIISKYPQFEDLYNTYTIIRNMCSIQKISDIVTIAMLADVNESDHQLIIMRALQVVSEYTKNTLESPKLSSITSELILLSFPKKARRIITELRNLSNHASTLNKRITIEQYADINFYTEIKVQIVKGGVLINNILNRYKIKMVRIFLNNIISSTHLPAAEEIEILSRIDLDGIVFTNKKMMKEEKIEEIIKKLSHSMGYRSVIERGLLKQIWDVIDIFRCETEKIRPDYETGFKSLRAVFRYFCDSKANSTKVIKFYADKILGNMGHDIDFNSLKSISMLTLKICHGITSRIVYNLDEIFKWIYTIFHNTELAGNDIKWAEELRTRLHENDLFISSRQELGDINKTEEIHKVRNENYASKLESKLSLLKSSLITRELNYPIVDYYFYKINIILQTIIEMLVFDALSTIIDQSKFCLEKNELFLDIDDPILTGTGLLDYLACGKEIVDVSTYDPCMSILLNAVYLDKNYKAFLKNTENTSLVSIDPNSLKDKYHRDLIIVANQEKMFSALEDGNLEAFLYTIEEGADINAEGNNSGTALHFAAKGSLEVVKLILNQDLDHSIKDIDGQSPLHTACAYGKVNIVDYFLKEKIMDLNSLDHYLKTPLHFAASSGHIIIVQILLVNRALYIRDNEGFSPLHYAIKNNHIGVVKLLIKYDRDDINDTSGGFTPLFIAAEHGHCEIVNILLENNADVNTRKMNKFNAGETPLHVASMNGHLEVVKALIKRGANVNSQSQYYGTPLHYACENDQGKIVEFLLKNGADIEAEDNFLAGRPLHYAAKKGNENVVKILLKNKANSNAANTIGMSPLHYAVQSDSLKTVIALVNHGADINFKDSNDAIPLHFAVEKGHKKIVDFLIKNSNARINCFNNEFRTPLHTAAMRGYKDVVSLLIKNKAKLNVQDIRGVTPLHVAVKSAKKDVVEVLIKNKAEINHEALRLLSPLHVAIIESQTDIVKLLIKNGAQVNQKEISHGMSMHAAVESGSKEIMKILIESGGDINAKCENNFSPLTYAIINNSTDVLRVLLENGARFDVTDRKAIEILGTAVLLGFKDTVDAILKNQALINIIGPDDVTFLHLAIKKGYVEIVKSLLKKGADVNIPTKKSASPLFIAVEEGREEIVDILIKSGALVNTSFNGKFTPLHVAARRGYTKIVEALLKGGAEIDALTTCNSTPLFYAVMGGYEKTVGILADHGCQINFKLCEGLTVLHVAAMQDQANVVKVLLDYGADINARDNDYRTPLYTAIMFGSVSVLELMLQCNDVNIRNIKRHDSMILHIAVTKTNLPMVKYLVSKGCNINAQIIAGLKPIHIAALEGFTDIVDFFLRKGLSVNEPTRSKHTLLHCAIMKNQAEVVNYLIEQGANTNAVTILNETPLHTAAKFGNINIINALLKNGANYRSHDIFNRKPSQVANDQTVTNLLESTENLFDVVKCNNYSEADRLIKMGAFINVKTSNYGTPLLYATWKGYCELVNILLENKADPNLANNKGYTPLHYASAFSHRVIVIALLSHGAIYNAVSRCGKTPLDLAVDDSVMNDLAFVSESFKKVQDGNLNVIHNLNSKKDIGLVRAVMRSQNKDRKTLVDVAVENKFSEIEQLKDALKTNEFVLISNAYLLFEKGDLKEALIILEKVFDKRKEMQGIDNWLTLKVQLLVAYLHFRLRHYKEAFNLYDDFSTRMKKVYGPNNEYVLHSRNVIVLIHQRLGQFEESVKTYRDIYTKLKERFGKSHIETLKAKLYKALIKEKLGNYEEACQVNRFIFKKAIEILGPFHPFTISAESNIAMSLVNTRQYKEALKIYIDVYEKKKTVSNIRNASRVLTLQHTADILYKLNKYDLASEFYQIVLNIFEKFLGKHHSDTLNTQYKLADALLAGGQTIKAIENFKECFYNQIEILGFNNLTILDIFGKIKKLHFFSKTESQKKLKSSIQLQKFMGIAASNGDIKTIQILVMDGIDVNGKDDDGKSPLFYAVSNGQVHAVNTLLKNGADATQPINDEKTLLNIAITRNYKEIVEALLLHVKRDKFNEFINPKNVTHGNTPLHVAASRGSFEMTKCLLNHGAIFNVRNIEGKMPLHVSKDRRIYKLLKFIEDLFDYAKNGDSIILEMIRNARKDEFTAVINTRNDKELTLAQVTLMNNHSGIGRKLLEEIKLRGES